MEELPKTTIPLATSVQHRMLPYRRVPNCRCRHVCRPNKNCTSNLHAFTQFTTNLTTIVRKPKQRLSNTILKWIGCCCCFFAVNVELLQLWTAWTSAGAKIISQSTPRQRCVDHTCCFPIVPRIRAHWHWLGSAFWPRRSF